MFKANYEYASVSHSSLFHFKVAVAVSNHVCLVHRCPLSKVLWHCIINESLVLRYNDGKEFISWEKAVNMFLHIA